MSFVYSVVQTLVLFVLCIVAFSAAMLVLPFLSQGEGLLMQIWNIGMANAAFYGLPYWHLSDLKESGFLPRANSYVLIWILAALTIVALPISFFADFEPFELAYAFVQAVVSCVALFYAHKFQNQR